MRIVKILACIWIIFLVRGVFYASCAPLWEGFDEWAHYATLQNIATGGRALIERNDPVSREVQASLELAPIPWLVNGLKQDDYWRLSETERPKGRIAYKSCELYSRSGRASRP